MLSYDYIPASQGGMNRPWNSLSLHACADLSRAHPRSGILTPPCTQIGTLSSSACSSSDQKANCAASLGFSTFQHQGNLVNLCCGRLPHKGESSQSVNRNYSSQRCSMHGTSVLPPGKLASCKLLSRSNCTERGASVWSPQGKEEEVRCSRREGLHCCAAYSSRSMDYGYLEPNVRILNPSIIQAELRKYNSLSLLTWYDPLSESIILDNLSIESSITYHPQPQLSASALEYVYEHLMRTIRRSTQCRRIFRLCMAQLRNTILKTQQRVRQPSKKLHGFPHLPSLAVSQCFNLMDSTYLLKHRTSAWLQQMNTVYGSSLLVLLVLGYWIQGFRCFPWLAVSYHLKDGLQVKPATLQFLQSTVNFPMVLKPVYGILSDAVYIGGARRMPYLVIASLLQVLSWCAIAIHPGFRSSVGTMTIILALSNLGGAMAEVVSDALVAESRQKEKGHSKGELQSVVWLALATGGVLGNLSGGFALSRMNSSAMFAIFSTLVAAQLIACCVVKEQSFGFKMPRPSWKVLRSRKKTAGSDSFGIYGVVREQVEKLRNLVRRPDILQPLAWFAASYAMIPSLGGSIFFYQTQFLKIDPAFLGLAKVVGQVGLLVGSILYNRFLKTFPLRKLLILVQILLSLCMLSDILLVSRLNLRMGIPDKIFVLGASAFVEAIAQFKVLPFMVLLTKLCPAGSEGSLLSFFMSCHCLASILSGYLGVTLASMLQLSADNFSALTLGIFIQSMAAIVPLLWIDTCIPDDSKVSSSLKVCCD